MPRDAGGATLWELASVVREEVEKVFREEDVAGEVSNLVLLHLIETRVKNVRLEEDGGEPRVRAESLDD